MLKDRLLSWKDKYQKKSKRQKEIKKQWNDTYLELVEQIKRLKDEIDAISFDNRRLIASF